MKRLPLVLIAVSVLIFAGGCRLQQQTFPIPGAGQVADDTPAPSFSGTLMAKSDTDILSSDGIEGDELDGDRVSLADLEGHPIVLNFWASWCGPCRLEQPDLQRVWEENKDKGVQFIGVNFRDTDGNARAYLDEFGVTYPSIFDPSGEVAFKYSVAAIPATVFIRQDGTLLLRYPGAIPVDALEQAVAQLVEE